MKPQLHIHSLNIFKTFSSIQHFLLVCINKFSVQIPFRNSEVKAKFEATR